MAASCRRVRPFRSDEVAAAAGPEPTCPLCFEKQGSSGHATCKNVCQREAGVLPSRVVWIRDGAWKTWSRVG
jgi:hypothetical protein